MAVKAESKYGQDFSAFVFLNEAPLVRNEPGAVG